MPKWSVIDKNIALKYNVIGIGVGFMRIMTSNIWGDYFENPVSVREDLLFKVFEKYSPDVLGMQEYTPGWYAGNMYKWLSDEYYPVGTELYDNINYVPMAIKKEYKLLNYGYEYLENTPDKSKGITWAVIEKDGKKFGVCNTHFWWMTGTEHDLIRLDNARQLSNIMMHLYKRYNCPVFAFGDMNTTISSGVFEIYKENRIIHLREVALEKDDVSSHHGDPVVTESGRYKGNKTDNDFNCSIDHIVGLGENFTVLQYRIVEDIAALDATDHSPVYIDVKI